MEDTSVFVIVALPIAIALIMGSLGLSLTPADFRRVVEQPRGIAIGLANLFVISPLLGFAVAELYGLDPAFAVGLVVLAAAPGGTMANLLTHLARGDTALSISMTALSSLAAAVTIPLYLTLAVAHFDAPVGDDVTMVGIVARVFAMTIIPLGVGMRIRAKRAAWAIASEPRIKRVALAAFFVVVVGAVADEFGTLTEHIGELAVATITLNLAAMAVSFTVSRAARLDNRQATAVALELGLHNSTLAIAVGALLTDDIAIPAAVYSAFMFITAGAFARLMYRRNAGAEELGSSSARAAAQTTGPRPRASAPPGVGSAGH